MQCCTLSPQLPMNHSPALKKLESWLKVHPHFNVEPKWGPLVIAWVREFQKGIGWFEQSK